MFSSQTQASPFSGVFQSAFNAQETGVQVTDIIEDSSEPERRYLPGHPDADASGYVAFPKMNPAEDMVDLLSASRGYEANVSAMTAIKDMISKSIDLLRT